MAQFEKSSMEGSIQRDDSVYDGQAPCKVRHGPHGGRRAQASARRHLVCDQLCTPHGNPG